MTARFKFNLSNKLFNPIPQYSAGSSSPSECAPFKTAVSKIHSRLLSRFFLGLFTILSIVLFSSLQASASVNSISAINVTQLENTKYNIVIKLDKNIRIKKIQNGSENLTLILNSTLPSDSLEIIYDNAENLQNVIVQKKNDNTYIQLQGKNISGAKIFTKEIPTGILKEVNEQNGFYLTHKKICLGSIALLLMFFIMIRRKYKKYYIKKANSALKNTKVNTLRTKNMTQTKKIPSINYRINSKMSIPKDFVINEQEIKEIRKAG